MIAPRSADLFAWEWRHVGRSPLLWSILVILAASFAWGAISTAKLHSAQEAALERARAADAAFVASTAARARAYRAPVTATAGQVAYWQDPTNVAGYSEYFIRKSALKPHLPLSPLAAGVSDLAPSRLEIKLNTPFGFIDTYDFENPRGLALGRFDLAFAIVFLLPIGLLLLFALLVTFERDRGMLPLVAAQAVAPRTWIGVRVAAILAWSVPVVVLAIVISIGLAGGPLAAVAGSLAVAILITVLYMLFWSAVALLVLGRQPGAGAALGSFAAIWAALTIGLPLAGSALVGAIDPAPSAIEYVDAQRRIADEVQAGRDVILTAALLARPDLRDHADRATTLDYATRLSFLVPETERRLSSLRSAIEAHRTRQEKVAGIVGFVVPTLGVESAFAALAGTDPARQRLFEAQARQYQQRLRKIVHPLVQQEITQPPAPSERSTRGRLNLPEPLALPKFQLVDRQAAVRIATVLPFTAWLALLALVLGALGIWRTREWRVAQ
jgi:ABC-2 type transport system permease protein